MKILFVSLGCDKNLVDTENMLGILKNKGFEFTVIWKAHSKVVLPST